MKLSFIPEVVAFVLALAITTGILSKDTVHCGPPEQARTQEAPRTTVGSSR